MPSSLVSLAQGLLMLASLVGWVLWLAGAVVLRARLGTPGSRWLLWSTAAMVAWQVVSDTLLVLGGLFGVLGPGLLMLGNGVVHSLLWLAVAGSFFAAMRELSQAWRAGVFVGVGAAPRDG